MRALQQTAQKLRGITATLLFLYERRSDDDAVDVRGQSRHLLAAANPEACAHGQR